MNRSPLYYKIKIWFHSWFKTLLTIHTSSSVSISTPVDLLLPVNGGLGFVDLLNKGLAFIRSRKSLLLSPSIVEALELCTAENVVNGGCPCPDPTIPGLECGDQCLEDAWVNLPLLLLLLIFVLLLQFDRKKSAEGGPPFWRLAITAKKKRFLFLENSKK